MKFRTDFVTNSSSSSFRVFLKAELSDGTAAWFNAYDPYNCGVCDLLNMGVRGKSDDGVYFRREDLYPADYFDSDDEACELTSEEEDKTVSVNLAYLLPDYEGLEAAFSSEKMGQHLVEFAGIADNQYEEIAKDSLMVFAERMRDENLCFSNLVLDAVFGGSAEMYWYNFEIVNRIFPSEQATQLIEVLEIKDPALREEKIFDLEFLWDFTWTSVMDLMYMWDHFDGDTHGVCYMRQTLRKDGYIEMVFTWNDDRRHGREHDCLGRQDV